MEIEDIQLEGDKVHVRFMDFDSETGLTVVMSKDDAWAISAFCRDYLSLAAQKKK